MTQRQIVPDVADVHTPLLYNHWYVAGYVDEFAEGLHERTFLDRSILIYRTQAGELVALQNRCAHRSFPLSHGWREGDEVRCRYHGAKYNSTGEMVEFPSMARCPNIKIRHYPIRAVGPLAWIWMGASDSADEQLIPATPWLFEDAGWVYATGNYELAGNWLLMAENLMDLTHIPFLHKTSFQFPKAFAETPVKLEINGDQLSYYRDNPPNYQRSGFLTPETSELIEKAGFHARSTVNFISPALTHGGGRFVLETPGPDTQSTYEWQVIHFTTPVTQSVTQYWYFFSRNYLLDDVAHTDKIRRMIVAGFEEDRTAIELVQAMHDRDTHDFKEVHFKSDGPSVSMRRIVATMAKREREMQVGSTDGNAEHALEAIAI